MSDCGHCPCVKKMKKKSGLKTCLMSDLMMSRLKSDPMMNYLKSGLMKSRDRRYTDCALPDCGCDYSVRSCPVSCRRVTSRHENCVMRKRSYHHVSCCCAMMSYHRVSWNHWSHYGSCLMTFAYCLVF